MNAIKDPHQEFMHEAIRLAHTNLKKNAGGPFGCVIVKDGKILARGSNSVTNLNDPTAHAEVVAIRKACKKLKTFQLNGCDLYCSCEPCPMCLGAIYWSRPSKVYFAASRKDAATAGFDDDFIYHEILIDLSVRKIPFEKLDDKEAIALFAKWNEKADKTRY